MKICPRVQIFPRRKNGQEKKASAIVLVQEDITRLHRMRQADAAKYLGISLSALKNACRRLGVPHWPSEVGSLPCVDSDHESAHVRAGSEVVANPDPRDRRIMEDDVNLATKQETFAIAAEAEKVNVDMLHDEMHLDTDIGLGSRRQDEIHGDLSHLPSTDANVAEQIFGYHDCIPVSPFYVDWFLKFSGV
ncbi:hypothetical protein GUITHDRAFT_119869 [Guillardia theta CCMP2712]|uniref:RWP-RK domain-containing protein n=1 Tax=Guillardia theta (strain CCMP2712) TaxID=905079 RepID=L1ICI5_GUITC|nr:hypothetical protein GUITHDRAFT_119869 [Guillardia theta CCMP2712]EKX33943.1 hypothetical protein GUITHDRAFT_119869 [Guillardia theta CCMP2712]|eukprot:XP_005820923.1 hypothetical protein GUITHDRAFT_119869 [Guillardia theta CCMP2712]